MEERLKEKALQAFEKNRNELVKKLIDKNRFISAYLLARVKKNEENNDALFLVPLALAVAAVIIRKKRKVGKKRRKKLMPSLLNEEFYV